VIRSVSDDVAGEGFDMTGAEVTPGMYSIDARYDVDGGFIETTRPGGSAFPATTMSKVWKPVYEWLEDLSSIESTNLPSDVDSGPIADKKYIYYVDEKNRFHWFYPTNTANRTLEYGSDSGDFSITGVSMKKATFDVINMVIFNSGIDLDGRGILWYFYNVNSKDKKLKMKYKPYTDIARDIRDDESKKKNGAGTPNITIKDDDSVTINNSSGTTSWDEAYVDEADYKSKFREYCKRKGSDRAMALTNSRGSPRWKGSIEFPGFNCVPGELIDLTIPPFGIQNVKLRVKDVSHQINKSSWGTSLDLEEDGEAWKT